MRVRITLQVMDDNYQPAESIPPVDALFADKITAETVANAQGLVARALEIHTRSNKRFDGLAHWPAHAHQQPTKE
jgi:hypothetical protein